VFNHHNNRSDLSKALDLLIANINSEMEASSLDETSGIPLVLSMLKFYQSGKVKMCIFGARGMAQVVECLPQHLSAEPEFKI
jgi:hypothetical protein